MPVSRRHLLTAAIAVPALSTMAACGGSSDGKANLTFYWWGDDNRATLTSKVLDLYTSRHPDVTFRKQWQGYTGYYDKLSTTAAGDNAPDIFQVDEDGLAEFAGRHVTMDLDPLLGKAIKTTKFAPGLATSGTVDGSRVAIPAAENTPALCYDAQVADKYKVGALRSGMSWDDFIDWAAEITRASGGKIYGTADPGAGYQALEVWLRQRGKDLYAGTKLGFTADDLAEWWQYWVRARARGATPPPDITHTTNGGDITKSLIATRKGATAFQWSNQLEALSKSTDHKLGIVAYPGPPGAQWARSSMYWAIYRGTKFQQQAADVVNFLVNDPAAGKILGAERGLAVNTDVRRATAPTLSTATRASATFETELSAQFGKTPQVPPKGHTEIRQNLITLAETVQFGKQKPAAAAQQFVDQAKSTLSG